MVKVVHTSSGGLLALEPRLSPSPFTDAPFESFRFPSLGFSAALLMDFFLLSAAAGATVHITSDKLQCS